MTVSTLPLGDLFNTRRLAEAIKDQVRYSEALGFTVWDGMRHRPDDTREVWRLACDTAIESFREAVASGDKDRIRFAATSTNESKIAAAIELLKSELGVAIHASAFDRDKWKLNTPSGIVDLRTRELKPHDPAGFFTKVTGAFYREGATCPRFLTFLDEIFGHSLDLIEYVQRAFGYAVTGDTSEQCLFILWGGGANGKSTLIETVRSVLGDYSTQTPTETLMARREEGCGNDVARLRGARFIAAVETAEGRRLNETLVKRLTGQDTLAARFLYKEHFEFRPTGKLFIATNHKPVVTGTDHALWRRVRLVPFTVTIPPERQNRHLREELLANEGAGILHWLVEGAVMWQKNGLGEPAPVLSATAAYQTESDRLSPFIADCCVVRPGLYGFGVFDAYKAWCGANGEPPMSARDFAGRMAEKGFPSGRQHRGRYFQGIGLLAADQECRDGVTA